MKLNQFAILFVLFGFLSAQAQSLIWKGVFIAGDDSIENFDNGRVDISNMLGKLMALETVQLTSSKNKVTSDVAAATVQNIGAAFASQVKTNEGCFVHMTSHGAKNQGFYLSMSGILSPKAFAQMVNKKCGNAPTIILISACYSGQFVTNELKGPNRVIMTAAIHDRPSFGCSPDTRYTYWDACLLSEIPKSKTWVEVAKRVEACIATKESSQGFPSSYPQSQFGANTANWTVRN